MINNERLLERFLKYVQIDSPTKFEREFAEVLMEELKELGLEVRMDKAGEKVGSNSGNVLGFLKATSDGEPILFSSHMDTVSPSIGVKPIIRDGVVYSDGTTILGGDDKAGVAAIMETLQTIVENNIPHGDIEVSFSIFEEGGLFGAKNLDYSQIKSKKAFILDSGGQPGEIIVAGPAQNKIDIKFIGKPAHAGVAPEEGISAIQMASYAIENMKLLRIDEETTANIGIVTGGQATNIVMETLNIVAEARSLDNDKLEAQSNHMKAVCEEAAAKFGGSVEVTINNAYGAFNVDVNSEIVLKTMEAAKNIGLNPHTAKSGGGSDTNIFNSNGITAINLGIGEKKAHTLEEHIHIKDLEAAGRLALEIVKTFA